MYVSRLAFHTMPGKTHQVEEHLKTLRDMALAGGAARCRILRSHFASLGSPDVVFEQDADDLQALDEQIGQVASKPEFRQWSDEVSALLREPPKREVYLIQD